MSVARIVKIAYEHKKSCMSGSTCQIVPWTSWLPFLLLQILGDLSLKFVNKVRVAIRFIEVKVPIASSSVAATCCSIERQSLFLSE